jgi:hypothetical protein
VAFLERILAAGFSVTLADDGFIEIEPSDKLTDEQRVFIKSQKIEIIEEIRKNKRIAENKLRFINTSNIINDLVNTSSAQHQHPINTENQDETHLDTRRNCRQCQNFQPQTKYCTAKGHRQIDDIPRHCEDFSDNGLPAPTTGVRYPAGTKSEFVRIAEEAPAMERLLQPPCEAAAYPKPVTCHTPAGNPVQVLATDPGHEAFLLRVNPKPKANP